MKAKFTFELYRAQAKGKKGWRTRIRSRNGDIVFNGGQLYTRRIDAENVISKLIYAVKFGDFQRLDEAHGRTIDRAPNTEDDPDAEVVDA